MKKQIAAGQWAAAQGSWNDLLGFIATKSGNVVSAQCWLPHSYSMVSEPYYSGLLWNKGKIMEFGRI